MFRRFSSGSRSPWRSLSLSLSRSRSRSRSRRGTLAHRGASTTRVDHPNSDSRAATKREFDKLEHRQYKLEKASRKITKKINMLGGKMVHINDLLKKFKRADSLPTAVIHFVHQLEKANMYFQFKRRAKQRHNSEAICWERTYTSKNEPVLMDWIYNRVCHVLQGDYVMDKDPEVELKKMMESDPDEYDTYFLQRPANYNKMSKQEAYKRYSKLVSIINTVSKEALEEKRKSTLATSARNKKRKV